MQAIQIDKTALLAEVPYLAMIEQQRIGWDDLGAALNLQVQGLGPQNNTSPRMERSVGFMTMPKQLWEAVKKEVFALFCTKDRKYAGIRRKIGKYKEAGTLQILTAIALWLSGIIGVAPAMLTPLVATVLYAIASMGGNAWCAVMRQRIAP